MKIKNIKIENFKGIEKCEVDLSQDKVFFLAANNGNGKTSFLEAVNFLLTKNAPENFIRNNSGTAKVSGEINGYTITRACEAGGTIVDFLNEKKAKVMDINRVIYNGENNSSLQTALNIVSSNAFDSMSSSELADFLLKFITEKPSLDTIISFMDNPDDASIQYLKKSTELSAFSLEDIHSLYQHFYSSRTGVNRIAKQKITEITKPDKNLDEITKRIEEIAIEETKYQNYCKLANSYNLALQNKKKYISQIKQLEQEIQEIENAHDVKEELKKKQEVIDKDIQDIQYLTGVLSTIENTILSFTDTQKALKKSACPFSDKIVCSTDKSAVLENIKSIISQNKKEKTATLKKLKQQEEALQKEKEELQNLQKIDKAYFEKVTKMKQLNKMKENIPVMPEKPEIIEKKDFSAEKKELQELQQAHILYNQSLKQNEEIKKAKKEQKILNSLVAQFDAKGPVCTKIINYYLNDFEKVCNETAKLFHPDMRVKFTANNGLRYFVKVNKTKKFMPYKNLSGGEKTLALLIIIDLINQLSGSNILVIDELDVLDDNNFHALIHVLESDFIQKYDNVFLSMTTQRQDVVKNFSMISL